MARYRKVDPRIWNDAKFSHLSDNGKLVFFMLLTHPSMTALGAMRATIPGMAAELGWDAEAFREAFEEASSKGMAEHDEKACFVSLPSFLKYNPPESPNVVKAWLGSMDLLPECTLKTQTLQRAGTFVKGMTEGFAKAFAQAFEKAIPIQEQEQEQEQEQDSKGPSSESRSFKRTASKKAREITLAAYMAECEANGVDPIPQTDPVMTSAKAAGLPTEWIPLAWWVFQGRHLVEPGDKAKTYASWPQAFRNAVRENWLKLWWPVDEGGYRLTPAGVQAQREMGSAT